MFSIGKNKAMKYYLLFLFHPQAEFKTHPKYISGVCKVGLHDPRQVYSSLFDAINIPLKKKQWKNYPACVFQRTHLEKRLGRDDE